MASAMGKGVFSRRHFRLRRKICPRNLKLMDKYPICLYNRAEKRRKGGLAMATIRCRSCGRIYDYNKQDMCPKCGAYNRPPHRERVDPDGTVHFVEDQSIPPRRGKVCYEEKTCYEDQTRRGSREKAGHTGSGSARAQEWENTKNSVNRAVNHVSGMNAQSRGRAVVLIVAAVSVLISLIGSCQTHLSYTSEPEPGWSVEPATEITDPTDTYRFGCAFELMGQTGTVTEVGTSGQRIMITVEGLEPDTYYPPYLVAYDSDGYFVDLASPAEITDWDSGTTYTYDRDDMTGLEDAAQWTLEFDVLEEQDGSMVFTGDEVVVDLTGYIQ